MSGSAPSLEPRPLRLFGRDLPPLIEILRIGIGLVWATNLLFIVDPANDYWGTFSKNALSYAPSTIGGPGLAEYVSAHPLVFSWIIAIVTAYLAVALLLGLTTRTATLVGSCFSGILFATQFGSTFFFPGGTDVGEHPLYIIVYLVLALGGAGRSACLDSWLRTWWARPRKVAVPRRAPVPSRWSTSISPRTLFVYAVAGTLLSFGIGMGLVVAMPIQPTPSAAPPGPTHYVNLTIDVNGTTGWPYYTPANFSVPAGRVVFTITDNDSPVNWSGCPCTVRGTVGGVELVNGTPTSHVSSDNVAHTFSIEPLGLQILSPGLSVVQFTVDILGPGDFTWFCLAPCGAGSDPYSTPPMGTPGMMSGTMTVT